MTISCELAMKLNNILSCKEPTNIDLGVERTDDGLSFIIFQGNHIQMSAVFNDTLIAEFKLKEVKYDLSTNSALFFTESGSVLSSKYMRTLQNSPTVFVDDEECEMLIATVDPVTANNLKESDISEYLKKDYVSKNGGWVLKYANGDKYLKFGQCLIFKYDGIDVLKKYIKLYDTKDTNSVLYISRSISAPF